MRRASSALRSRAGLAISLVREGLHPGVRRVVGIALGVLGGFGAAYLAFFADEPFLALLVVAVVLPILLIEGAFRKLRAQEEDHAKALKAGREAHERELREQAAACSHVEAERDAARDELRELKAGTNGDERQLARDLSEAAGDIEAFLLDRQVVLDSSEPTHEDLPDVVTASDATIDAMLDDEGRSVAESRMRARIEGETVALYREQFAGRVFDLLDRLIQARRISQLNVDRYLDVPDVDRLYEVAGFLAKWGRMLRRGRDERLQDLALFVEQIEPVRDALRERLTSMDLDYFEGYRHDVQDWSKRVQEWLQSEVPKMAWGWDESEIDLGKAASQPHPTALVHYIDRKLYHLRKVEGELRGTGMSVDETRG